MILATPWALSLLLLVPLVAWWSGRSRARAAVRYSSVDLLTGLRPTLRQRVWWLPGLLATAGAGALIVALARPQTGIGEVRTTAKGVAISIVLDRSASMQLPLRFSGRNMMRIDVVKQVLREFVLGNGNDLKGRPEDLLGLVTFARFPETVCPLVRIHGTLVKLVDAIELAQDRWEGGTAIGDGLMLAAARLKKAEEELAVQNKEEKRPDFQLKSKVIVLLTDGDENVGEVAAADAAQLCREWGIKIYAIGIGDDRGGVVTAGGTRVPIAPGGGFDEELMKSIAKATGGAYWRATNGEALRQAYATIDELE
ncbi:MAG: VWA domain-containing protein, partial [Phycisphaerae bacterium]|nr:VWA domain-containing protein [Phycisphaerae bacterium]